MRGRTTGAVLVALCLVLAGCSGGAGPGPATTAPDAAEKNGTGTDAATADTTTAAGGETAAGSAVVVRRVDDGVDFYVSDQENAIDQFRHLNVTISRVGFERAGGGWVERDVDGRTVDLTRLRGANATRLTNVDVPNGTYVKVFAYVSEVNGTLTDGTETEVKLPSERLQLQKRFTVGANGSVDFVFDIAVHRAGNSGRYILRPVVSESGTDVPIRSVDEEDQELTAAFVGNVTRGGNATLNVTRGGEPVPNATVSVDDERVGTTDENGQLTVAVPDREEFELTIEAGDEEAELGVEFREREEQEEEDEGEEGEEDDAGDDGGDDEGDSGEDDEAGESDGDEGEPDGGDEENEEERDADERDGDDAETEEGDDDDEDADDQGDDEEAGEEAEEPEAALNASFVGEVARGENATVAVTRNGSAVANATVTVNDERVGTTDENGELTFGVPDAETVTVEVARDGAEAELEAEFGEE